MKYLIVGAGGAGGCLAAFMTEGGLDVAVVDRGEHLEAIKRKGITLETEFRGTYTVAPVRAFSTDEYNEEPDVIILCVKEYSARDVLPFIRRIARPGVILIPVISVFDMGIRLQTSLKELNVMDGCIYVAAVITEPGTIKMYGRILSVVYGVRDQDMYTRWLDKIAYDLRMCGIEGTVSDDIMQEMMKKFSYISPLASTMFYFECTAGAIQQPGKERDLFIELVNEVEQLSEAMNIPLHCDIVGTNLSILSELGKDTTVEMTRDIAAGRPSEIDGLVFEMLRRSDDMNVKAPAYEMVAEKAIRCGCIPRKQTEDLVL
ncbi:MAG: 2-dehydropantoate 2-reductase [Oscillospiraceae bacterium]|nr:2-dehydropantoate 2-reductase [Oscillospiraceae bacterium]